MTAAALRAFGEPLTLERRPLDPPAPDLVRVRVHACGVCHSDLHIVDGRFPTPLPLVLGHEVSGWTAEHGDVLVWAMWGCGTCATCRSGAEQLCRAGRELGFVRDGGYAEYVDVRPSSLVPLRGLDPVHAAPLADAGVTALRAVRRAERWLTAGARALVIGAGGLGQFAVQLARLLGDAEVTAADRDAGKRARALELGAHAADALDRLDGRYDAILDFVGTAETLTAAERLLARSGVLVQVGVGGGAIPFGMYRVPHEAWLTTSFWGTQADLADVVEIAASGALRWAVEALPLTDVNSALERLRGGDVAGRLALVPGLDAAEDGSCPTS